MHGDLQWLGMMLTMAPNLALLDSLTPQRALLDSLIPQRWVAWWTMAPNLALHGPKACTR